MPFAVIDFETTGVAPERTDRVVEVGIVLVDDQGTIEDKWTTLVNPRRDVGASHIHGITTSDVLNAPEFAEISDHILAMLAGRVTVAHNASFDMRFLHAELRRANYAITERPAALCSMKWAGRLIGAAKLTHCCEAFDIPLTDAHSALADAYATAQLMPYLLNAWHQSEDWQSELFRSNTYPWPQCSTRTSRFAAALRGQAAPDSHAWLRTVLEAAWIPATPENEAAYLVVLENALLDRTISHAEGKQLVGTAETGGLSRATIGRLHQDYLRAVAVEALDDGVVTDDERKDLDAVAAALGLGAPYVEESLAWAATSAKSSEQSIGFALQPGDRVVFTGDMTRSREHWIATISSAGLTSGGITKSTRLLVAADPDSLSGKATKARDHGIPVVTEASFERIFSQFSRPVSA